MNDEDKPCTRGDLSRAINEVKKEVRWLLILGLAGSQLIKNIDLPSAVSVTGAVIGVGAFVGKVAVSYFVR